MTESSYQQLLRQFHDNLLPQSHPYVKLVEQITQRLVQSLDYFGISSHLDTWKVHVIKAPMQNAFVLPGGQIFIFTGIFDIVKTADGLATVLGHEIAHAVARHPAENMSIAQLLSVALLLVKVFVLGDISDPLPNFIANVALKLPFSRKVELEADRIGLLLMSRACYDPKESIQFWKRMARINRNENVPSFLSTHPASQKRIEKLTEWLPEALQIRDNSDCYSWSRGTNFKWQS